MHWLAGCLHQHRALPPETANNDRRAESNSFVGINNNNKIQNLSEEEPQEDEAEEVGELNVTWWNHSPLGVLPETWRRRREDLSSLADSLPSVPSSAAAA